jgi:hypothetical protein
LCEGRGNQAGNDRTDNSNREQMLFHWFTFIRDPSDLRDTHSEPDNSLWLA